MDRFEDDEWGVIDGLNGIGDLDVTEPLLEVLGRGGGGVERVAVKIKPLPMEWKNVGESSKAM